MEWYRAYHDMHLDPKWRAVAMDAGCKVRDVVAVWVVMLNRASKAADRGTIAGWNDKVEGAAIDMTGDEVRAIREAMQGLVLNGDELINWSKYQPKREDGASERAKAWRERNRTQANADEPERTLDKIREDKKELSNADALERDARKPSPPPVARAKPVKADQRGSRLPDGWELPDDWRAFAESLGIPPPVVAVEADKFRDFWRAKAGADGRKLDWAGTWRNWCRRVMETKPHARTDQHEPKFRNGFAELAFRRAQDRSRNADDDGTGFRSETGAVGFAGDDHPGHETRGGRIRDVTP
jgi:hypothetical protein